MSDITQITSEHVSAHGLPANVFQKKAIYTQESNKIFAAGWASIGCAQQLEKPGDILPIRIAGQSLIAVKNREGRVSVFHNVCRHKAAPLVDEPCNKRSIVCPVSQMDI